MFNENAHTETGHETPPEVRLWQAIITKAITDWMSGPLRQKRQAEQYLFHDNTNFPMACQSAGMDASALRARLEKLRRKNAGNAPCAQAA